MQPARAKEFARRTRSPARLPRPSSESSSGWTMILLARRRTREADISHYGCVTGSWVAPPGYMLARLFFAGLTPAIRTHTPRPSLPSASAVLCIALHTRTEASLRFAHVRSTQIPKSGKLGAKVINTIEHNSACVLSIATVCYFATVSRGCELVA